MQTLHEILCDTQNEYLACRLKLLEIKPKSQRKADMIHALEAAFVGDRLVRIWSSMSSLEQKAILEACYSSDLSYDSKRIKAKYGVVPEFYKIPAGRSQYNYYGNSKDVTRLNLLFYSPKRSQGYVVPEDLAERVRAMVPSPSSMTLPTFDEPQPEQGLYVRLTEREALSEVVALLRLAEQGNLRISEKTAMPSVAGRKKILECLSGGDFFPPDVANPPDKGKYDQEIGPIKPVGWSRLLKVSRYLGKVGTKSKLTPAGIKALRMEPHQVIKSLWLKWISNTAFDEFNRVNEIKGQNSKGHMTAKPPRRDAIIDSLGDCPMGEWINVDDFSNYMQADGSEFEISNNLWKLYLCDSQYGSFGYDSYGGWSTVQHRYILSFLFEVLATLGLIDIAYVHPKGALDDYTGQWGADDLQWLSRYDGLRSFRITSLGAYCLDLSDEFVPTKLESTLKLEVISNLNIRITGGSVESAEKLLLETWAEQVTEDTWRLEPKRAREAVERGQNPSDFAEFLAQCDDQPLPETVEGFLKSCESDGKAVKSLGDAQLFKCRDSKMADVICAQKELKNRCSRVDALQLVVLAAHVPKFRKVVKSLGLGIV